MSLELRAGRSLDDALKSLADRLSLDEVRSFATLLQQSKELGTSLSGALRVFSDEMRHKRMSLAEEKAHALPAKMSVPVTVCILPVVHDDRDHPDHRQDDGRRLTPHRKQVLVGDEDFGAIPHRSLNAFELMCSLRKTR